MPKISVIVPVYKVEPYLHRCVNSILNQTFSDFELILVDDGSPDNCGAFCDDYAKQDHRVHVIHQENGGLSAARNAGIDWAFTNSNSQWLTFIDSDDWIHKEYLMRLYHAAEQYGVSMSMCGLCWTDTAIQDKPLETVQELLLDSETVFVEHGGKSIVAYCKLVKKDLFSQIRFPVGKLHEDAFVTHKLLFACDRVVVLEEDMYYYFQNPGSITHAKWSDRKLDSIEAHEQRLEYFRERGLQRAYCRQQEIYVEELTYKIRHLLETRESTHEYQDTFLLLREKLQSAMKTARQAGLVQWNMETMWSYLFAMRTDVVWKTAMNARKLYHKIKK